MKDALQTLHRLRAIPSAVKLSIASLVLSMFSERCCTEMKQNMKKAFALFVLVFLGLNTNGALAQGLVTIDEIKKDALLGWHKTYEVNGNCISADIEIGVPEISAVPIVRIGYPPELEPVDVVHNKDDVTADSQGILVKKESADGVFWGSGDRFEMNDLHAENNPLTQNEAQQILEGLLLRYQEQTGVLDLRLYSQFASSRMYSRIKRDGDISDLDLDNPTTRMGTYVFEYEQWMHGIPYVTHGPTFPSIARTSNVNFAGGTITGEIASENDYLLIFNPAIEKDIILEDAKLQPLVNVVQAFENQIKAGQIREIRSMRLVYLGFMDPKSPKQTYVLEPAWELRGIMVENPSDQDSSKIEFVENFTKRYYGQYSYVHAISGECIGHKQNWEYADFDQYKANN
ncbi:MAG: hypothetical protein RSE58_12050 [Clostridia bacterium]